MFSKYNAKDTQIIVKGTYITGLGEDMWNFEKEEDYAEDSVGAQGDVVRNEINNPIHKATVVVQRTSPQFSFLRNLARETEPFSVWMINKAMKVKEGGDKAMLASAPPSAFGASAEDVEFVFTVYDGVSTDA